MEDQAGERILDGKLNLRSPYFREHCIYWAPTVNLTNQTINRTELINWMTALSIKQSITQFQRRKTIRLNRLINQSINPAITRTCIERRERSTPSDTTTVSTAIWTKHRTRVEFNGRIRWVVALQSINQSIHPSINRTDLQLYSYLSWLFARLFYKNPQSGQIKLKIMLFCLELPGRKKLKNYILFQWSNLSILHTWY